jgi:4-coumarate--CoA ligase
VTTSNPLYTTEELAHQLEDSRAKYIVTVPMFIDKAKEAVKIAGLDKKNLFVFGEAPDATPFSSLLKHGDNVSIIYMN